MASAEPIQELRELTAALRAYVEQAGASGAWGMPAASEALKQERRLQAQELAGPELEASAEPQLAAAHEAIPSGGVSFQLDDAPLAQRSAAPTRSLEALVGSVEASLQSRAASSGRPDPTPPPGARAPATEAAFEVRAVSAPVDLAERDARLKVLAATVASCQQCGLHAGRRQTVFARGTGSSGLCFVGEGPGADEDAQGFPFVGAAGQLLDRMIVAMGLDRDEVYVCNIVKCRPPDNRKPTPEEMASCIPFLHEQLNLMAPQVIVALGATAVQGLLGTSDGIMRLRGKWRLYRGRIAVMPTFHPAYLLRTPAAKREVWQDLQAVLQHLGRSIPKPAKG